MNVSHPSPHASGIRPVQQLHLDRSVRADQNETRTDGSKAAGRSLWEILTPEEREFFEQQASLGPLTYRPGQASRENAPAPTGRRIDVRG